MQRQWEFLPDPIFLHLAVNYLTVQDVFNCSTCCKRWLELSTDDYLWKKLFRRDFKVDKKIGLRPGSESWRSEYKRLTIHIPMVLNDELSSHSHQVLHVSFANNGSCFATCSKDGLVIVWDAGYPCRKKYSHNMKQFNWKYTQYSQFNQSDTLLLVSGVHFGAPHSSSGEIAVFSLDDDFKLESRVPNRPYDIFGTWFTDHFLISGRIHWLAHLVSTSVIWLNKYDQETSSEHVQITKELYKFYNKNGSTLRAVMVANCPWLSSVEVNDDQEGGSQDVTMAQPVEDSFECAGNPISTINQRNFPVVKNNLSSHDSPLKNKSENCSIQYTEQFRREYETRCQERADSEPRESSSSDFSEGKSSSEFEEEDVEGSDFDELEHFDPKYLIFSLGSKTYTPHQIGFKQIRSVDFPKKMDIGPSLKERIARRILEAQNQEPRFEQNWLDYDAVQEQFDKVDKLIDLHGHIIGMGLSPDHRYLYVNSRPWPTNYVITNPMEPPPIAQEIDIHVIDLVTLDRVGKMLRAHKAYTSNTECFFIFLDVCDNYVASGAEDKHAYLWDRYYGVCLSKYQHQEVVNSVAFNPKDNEMFVSVSDDFKIRVWRSLAKSKALGIDISGRERALKFKPRN